MAPQSASGSVKVSAPTPAIAAAVVAENTVENAKYKIVFTNKGAQVEHWYLKGYSDTAGKPSY